MKMRAAILDPQTHHIRFPVAKPGKATNVGRVVNYLDKAALMKSGQTYTTDTARFPMLLILGITGIALGAFLAGVAGVILGDVGLAAGGIFVVVSLPVAWIGLKRWEPTTYFFVNEGDPRPLIEYKKMAVVANPDGTSTSKTLTNVQMDLTLGPAPYDDATFRKAIESTIPGKVMEKKKDMTQLYILLLILTVILEAAALVARTVGK